jgi:hypothetical protein
MIQPNGEKAVGNHFRGRMSVDRWIAFIALGA